MSKLTPRSLLTPFGVAGFMFGSALMLLLDLIIVARGEPNAQYRVSLVLLLPALISVVGFVLLTRASPTDIRNNVNSAKGVVLLGWILCVTSATSALVVCHKSFSGLQGRTRAAPGVALVIFTNLVSLAGCTFLWAKQFAVTGL
ncbi:Uncharacterized protein family (UPF0220), putative [Trypanosoma equiperdum]|uniref:Uncharacterized protein n=3 Tax=Trypanozoon TaxID=39700 RepID=Q585A5_TRYB2|nr:hypothetical protein, conserved [Trypanosoma brucei brucei TREU927]AAX80396.1 hypothetical protein, conserved [Trypanosoma brucei]AAZ11705.1 hypothetical protein, conserved [Trypanosoma brucei brucei TREU927]SCU72571.1 Uncharacterised protein family (UPF0220), putative [Trypanosoma equiperdum]